MRQKMDTHGERARGDWLFPLAFDMCKNGNFLEVPVFAFQAVDSVDSLKGWGTIPVSYDIYFNFLSSLSYCIEIAAKIMNNLLRHTKKGSYFCQER